MRKFKARCPECKKEIWKLGRHLQSVHKLPREIVKPTMARKPKSPQRRCTVDFVRLNEEGHDSRNRETIANPPPPQAEEDVMVEDGPGSRNTATVRGGNVENPPLAQSEEDLVVEDEEEAPITLGEGEAVIRQFTADCRFAHGSLRSRKNVRQHVEQLRSVWASMSTTRRLEDWRKPMLFCEKWLKLHRSAECKYQPGTVRSYIGTVKMFLEFVSERYGEDRFDMVAWRRKLDRWSKNLLPDLGRRQFARRAQESGLLISPDDIAKICQCSTFRNAKRLLLADNSRDPAVVELKTARERSIYLDVLACLIILLVTSSGQRPMAMLNMTLKELAEATKQGEDHMVIAVLKHKTSYKGPANFPVSLELYDMLVAFARRIRPRGGDEDPLIAFPRSLRSAAPSGYLSKLLNTRYEKIIGKRLSCTMFRKTIISRILSDHPEHSSVLAHQMSHSQRTQQTYYSLPISLGQSAGIGRSIQNVFATTEEVEEEEICPAGAGGRTVFTKQQELEIARIFRPMIQGEMNISLANLRRCRTPDNAGMPLFRVYSDKQLVNKVRSIIKYK